MTSLEILSLVVVLAIGIGLGVGALLIDHYSAQRALRDKLLGK